MKRFLKSVVPVAVIWIACGDPVGVEPSDIAGTWNAINYGFVNKADLDDTVELISMGASLTVTFTSEGDFTWDFRDVDGQLEARSGTFSVDGSILTLSESGQDPDPFLATRNDDDMTLRTGNREFDFDEDGTGEPAELRIFLTRN
jgi:hypothetical protein